MVLTNKYTQILMEKFPNFKNSPTLAETVELYNDGTNMVNPYTIFTALTHYVVNELIKKNSNITQEEIDILNYIEEIRINYSNSKEGSEERDYDSAACTCFLENLLNRASANRIEYSRFIPYLGEKSKEYCRAWDKFTGVKSPGL